MVRVEKIHAKTAMPGKVLTGYIPSKMRGDNKPTEFSSRGGVFALRPAVGVRVTDDYFVVSVCALILRNDFICCARGMSLP